MYWFFGKGVRILLTSWYRPLQSTPFSLSAWRATTVVVEIYSLMGMVAGLTTNFGPFCCKDFSSGISSFLERLIAHLSWILEEVEEMTAVLKVLVVLKAILKVVVEDVEMMCLSFLIWVFLYCKNVFSFLLNILFNRFVQVGSSSLCYRDVFVLALSVWRWWILIFVHLILLWMSEHSTFFIMACSKSFPFHLICKVLVFTLFARHLRLKILTVLDLECCISSFFNFLASSRVSCLYKSLINVKGFIINVPLIQ